VRRAHAVGAIERADGVGTALRLLRARDGEWWTAPLPTLRNFYRQPPPPFT
jgi:hypothetical protein